MPARACAAATRAGLEALGFELFAEPTHRSRTVTAAHIPDGLDWKAFNADLKARGLLDTTLVVLSRIRRRKPIYVGGRDHTSHRLVSAAVKPPSPSSISPAARSRLAVATTSALKASGDPVGSPRRPARFAMASPAP